MAKDKCKFEMTNRARTVLNEKHKGYGDEVVSQSVVGACLPVNKDVFLSKSKNGVEEYYFTLTGPGTYTLASVCAWKNKNEKVLAECEDVGPLQYTVDPKTFALEKMSKPAKKHGK